MKFFTFKSQCLLAVGFDLPAYGLEDLSREGEGGLGHGSFGHHLAGVFSLISFCQIMNDEAARAFRVEHLKVVTLGDPPSILIPEHLPNAALTNTAHPHASLTGLRCERPQNLGSFGRWGFDSWWRHDPLG